MTEIATLHSPEAIKPTSLAGLWRRFGAFGHELLFLIAYLFITGLVFAAFSGETMALGRPQIFDGPIRILYQLFLFATIGAYFIFFWINGRRTLAFKTWQLQLRQPENLSESVPLKRAIIRYLAAWIGPAMALVIFSVFGAKAGAWWLLALLFNFLWAIVDRDKQFLHDRIAGTRVAHVRE